MTNDLLVMAYGLSILNGSQWCQFFRGENMPFDAKDTNAVLLKEICQWLPWRPGRSPDCCCGAVSEYQTRVLSTYQGETAEQFIKDSFIRRPACIGFSKDMLSNHEVT